VARAAAEGFVSHVTKPIDVDSLVRTIRNLPPRNKAESAQSRR